MFIFICSNINIQQFRMSKIINWIFALILMLNVWQYNNIQYWITNVWSQNHFALDYLREILFSLTKIWLELMLIVFLCKNWNFNTCFIHFENNAIKCLTSQSYLSIILFIFAKQKMQTYIFGRKGEWQTQNGMRCSHTSLIHCIFFPFNWIDLKMKEEEEARVQRIRYCRRSQYERYFSVRSLAFFFVFIENPLWVARVMDYFS